MHRGISALQNAVTTLLSPVKPERVEDKAINSTSQGSVIMLTSGCLAW